MSIDFTKTSHIFFFGAIIPLSSWIISQWFFGIFQNWPIWLEGPSPLAVYGIIFFLFDKYGWKWKIFRDFGVVWFPNLSGRWTGKQISSYLKDDKGVEVKGSIEIRQTFSKISVNAYYEKSDSYSATANFSKLNGEVYLYYSYDNDPSTLKQGTMQRHKGTAKIKKLPKENAFKGFYWNSIGNSGDMEYLFDQTDLLGRL